MVNMRGQEADFAAQDNHRGYVLKGAPWSTGVRPFRAMYDLGMTEDDDVLDYGCGSLRVGRFLITYLEPGRYYGIEPSAWAVKAGIKHEIGTSLARIKAPSFLHPEYDSFNASLFGAKIYDWVLVSGILNHCDHAQIRSILLSASTVLKPTGRIIATYLPQGPDHDGTGWLYPQQAAHYRTCIKTALLGTGLTMYDLAVPGDPATWFEARRSGYTA